MSVLSLEIFAQTCPGICKKRCKCDLEKHLGDGYVSRTKLKKAKQRERQSQLQRDASKIEKKALELRTYAKNPMANGKDLTKKKKKKNAGETKITSDKKSVAVGGKPRKNEAGWTSYLDATTGRPYYHHEESGR